MVYSGSHIILSKIIVFISLKIGFVTTNSADTDEMLRYWHFSGF